MTAMDKQGVAPGGITPGSEVIMHVSLKLSDGSAADSTKVDNKPAKLCLGDGSLSAGFEQQLLGLLPGASKQFRLSPEQAYGEPSPDLVVHMERSKFGAELLPEVGAIIAFTGVDGSEQPGVIRDIAGDSVTVDFNHPLAGQVLHVDVEILAVDGIGVIQEKEHADPVS